MLICCIDAATETRFVDRNLSRATSKSDFRKQCTEFVSLLKTKSLQLLDTFISNSFDSSMYSKDSFPPKNILTNLPKPASVAIDRICTHSYDMLIRLKTSVIIYPCLGEGVLYKTFKRK